MIERLLSDIRKIEIMKRIRGDNGQSDIKKLFFGDGVEDLSRHSGRGMAGGTSDKDNNSWDPLFYITTCHDVVSLKGKVLNESIQG